MIRGTARSSPQTAARLAVNRPRTSDGSAAAGMNAGAVPR